jgi:ribonucleoside-diphosphate reductase alpha chain
MREGILRQETMPSMRLLWSAGGAARANNAAAFNCSYVAPTKFEDFGDIMYLAMSGCGLGFSCEAQTVHQLPQIKAQTGKRAPAHVVDDSKEGWCDALVVGFKTWFAGKDITFDYSRIRPQGARLRTMGGKASGPEPLRALLDFARLKILARQNRRLTPIDAHDIICKIGEVVVVGGVRRTALISLSDLNDEELRHAKDGAFYIKEPQRAMANNSAVYLERPSATEFMEEWLALAKSGSGERGIFNRGGLVAQMPARRVANNKRHLQFMGANPCGEINLRSREFCNLSEVVCRKDDTEESLIRKIRLATLMGTYQCTLTDYKYIAKEWKKNCDDERLLGVSLTGQWDCPAVRSPKVLKFLKEEAIRANEKYAKRFGINASAAITCVKPSGTVSQLVDAASGMHPRHAPYYVRRVRIGANDSLFQMMKDQKAPHHPEVGMAEETATVFVLDFPVAAPKSSTFRNDQTAIEQLEYWKMVKENYTEHNPSVTISIGENEWLGAADWLYKNWDMIGGLSFLPRDNHVYRLAPYEAIEQDRYKALAGSFPNIDFSQIVLYEREDQTQGAKEAACVAGVCEI